ncbi:DUF2567 domain-containing protein [Petropleomorpha daqingensis]|uniref:LPXTG-motif cell wall-anchored protein n=1 Tax=Petropleomorpha daqingensis TaxID=2026353 RepID=A0A853CMN1_9ACTN|nr:DUF2567 domain-containing protein [Petropleomorpha daqingensis]NYJ07772.1 LPXTG-motif cell wall-anchored protein [Petropleomorpha daqingensis]
MSSPDPDDRPGAVPAAGAGPAWFPPAPAAAAPLPARRPWSAFREVRGDLRTAAVVVAVLAVSGFLVGLLWWLLAPRADFRITAEGPAAIGNPSEELFAADDAVFALLMAGLGLLAGLLAWFLLRRRRGIATLLALAVGTAAAGVIAWRLGELLGPAPSKAELADVGGKVTTALGLHSLPALAVGPFCAVLVYLAASLFTRRDDLGRSYLPPPVLAAEPTFPEPFDAPAGRSQG